MMPGHVQGRPPEEEYAVRAIMATEGAVSTDTVRDTHEEGRGEPAAEGQCAAGESAQEGGGRFQQDDFRLKDDALAKNVKADGWCLGYAIARQLPELFVQKGKKTATNKEKWSVRELFQKCLAYLEDLGDAKLKELFIENGLQQVITEGKALINNKKFDSTTCDVMVQYAVPAVLGRTLVIYSGGQQQGQDFLLSKGHSPMDGFILTPKDADSGSVPPVLLHLHQMHYRSVESVKGKMEKPVSVIAAVVPKFRGGGAGNTSPEIVGAIFQANRRQPQNRFNHAARQRRRTLCQQKWQRKPRRRRQRRFSGFKTPFTYQGPCQ